MSYEASRVLLVGIHRGLSNASTIRKDSESKWLARDNLETNPITINPETASHVAEQPSWIPNKVPCLISTCVSSDNSFLSVRQEPTSGP